MNKKQNTANSSKKSVLKKKPVVIVEALVHDTKGRLLLLKRSNTNSIYVGKWQLPGGKVEEGETPIEAINRELREEIACNCLEAKKIKEVLFSNIYKSKKELVKLIVFGCNIEGQLALSDEHSELKFFEKKKIPRSLLAPASKKAIF
jgi:8-oxo-dGTP diphosphatase